MNSRLVRELGSPVAEQRGWHWALTSFALEAFRASSKKEIAPDGTLPSEEFSE
jgi:hypothetical protein